ncbi:SDR family NAD(P)-dependent oxidoreductase [Euzebya rosea]|uniref:SDR family NAD(P)-dependent oxidoreductase n=1 Tax=Euzebya rosea TaxID=2052804 RepID=UPI000D3EBFCF|nr:SDR family NAD(P)-dependent oxidoreductase [Euzebya rosea]
MTVELNGKVAAITGGARGIGKAIAEAFVAEGMSVAIGDLDLELAQATAEELGDRVVAFELDVTVPSSMDAFVRSTEQAFGPLDVMVNNAGIMVVGDFLKEDDRATDLQIDVNVRGVLLGAKSAGRVMADRGQGHIVNIASAAGKVPIARLVTYVGTKHAVVGISDALRAELRPHGIQVSSIMPNVVNTRLGAGLGSSMIPSVEPEDVAAAVVRVVRGRRNEAMVPWILEPLRMLTAGLPSVARDFLTRALGGHDVMANTDDAVRDAYQAEALQGQNARR